MQQPLINPLVNPPAPPMNPPANPPVPPNPPVNPPANPGILDRATLEAIVRAVQANILNSPPGPPGPQGPPGQAAAGNSNGGSHFRASDLGFFHPDLEESYRQGDIVLSSKETIYREVYTFSRRVQDYAIIKGEDVVRQNLSIYFRGAALLWWLNSLLPDEKDALRLLDTGLPRTLIRLQERFKISISSALDQLTREVFTLQDTGNRRDSAGYIQNV